MDPKHLDQEPYNPNLDLTYKNLIYDTTYNLGIT
jgi:hypothetical protein